VVQETQATLGLAEEVGTALAAAERGATTASMLFATLDKVARARCLTAGQRSLAWSIFVMMRGVCVCGYRRAAGCCRRGGEWPASAAARARQGDSARVADMSLPRWSGGDERSFRCVCVCGGGAHALSLAQKR
jgi:hypothetical protein